MTLINKKYFNAVINGTHVILLVMLCTSAWSIIVDDKAFLAGTSNLHPSVLNGSPPRIDKVPLSTEDMHEMSLDRSLDLVAPQ